MALPRDESGVQRLGKTGASTRLQKAGIPLEEALDHGMSEAFYLRDPDGNGVELYRDRPQEKWPRTPDGGLAMYARPLDLDSLFATSPSISEP
jgi:catechol 2,3-dioxygenase